MVLDWQQRAIDDGLDIGRGVPLPVSACSVTRAEAMARDRGFATLLLIAGGLIALIAALQRVGEPSSRAWLGTIAAALVCGGGAVILRNRRASHIDPRIAVEVDGGGIRVRWPGGSEEIGFGAAGYDLRKWSYQGSYGFAGIVLDCGAGTIDLQDLGYRGGKRAAAAILAGAMAAGNGPRDVV